MNETRINKLLFFFTLGIIIVSLIFSIHTSNFHYSKISSDNVIKIKSSNDIKWTPNGTNICSAINNQGMQQFCSDGVGGAIITWEDFRSSSNYDIYAQRIDSNGNVLWTTNGVPICLASNDQYRPQIYSDGVGGAIITWVDGRNYGISGYDIYAQRIDSNGNLLWTINGVSLCTAFADQLNPRICIDGAGGAIIAWQDTRSGNFSDIYAQRVDISGSGLWGINGISISSGLYNQMDLQICSNGLGGAIIVWEDFRADIDGDIYAQRVDSSGTTMWGLNDVLICNLSNYQRDLRICTDGLGGVFISWEDYRSGAHNDIYAQLVDSNGNLLWDISSISICNLGNDQNNTQICSDGLGGAIIVWEDYRTSVNSDIYAQKVDSSGTILWDSNGKAICDANNIQINPHVCSDGLGGAVIVWEDYRNTVNYDIFAQNINSSGDAKWFNNGTEICTENNNQLNPQILSEAGSMIITWRDYRDGSDYDIYAYKIIEEISVPIVKIIKDYILFLICLGIFIISMAVAAPFLSLRKWRNLEFLKEKKIMLKEIPKKRDKKEDFYSNQFKFYEEETTKINGFRRNFDLASKLLEKDSKGLASIKVTPLEYRNDLKDIQNNDYKGFSNARIYPDEYRELRETIERKLGKPKAFDRLESWKKVNDTFLYDYRKNNFVIIEHESGLEIYIWAEALEKFFKEQLKDYLKEFLKEILQKFIEDLIEEIIDKLKDIISERRKKKKKGKNVDRVSFPDRFSIELRHLTFVFKIMLLETKEKAINVFKQLKEAIFEKNLKKEV